VAAPVPSKDAGGGGRLAQPHLDPAHVNASDPARPPGSDKGGKP
jgi:hypothetical protein